VELMLLVTSTPLMMVALTQIARMSIPMNLPSPFNRCFVGLTYPAGELVHRAALTDLLRYVPDQPAQIFL
jgi:hypothetical protein